MGFKYFKVDDRYKSLIDAVIAKEQLNGAKKMLEIMKTKILCDRCKKEFEEDEELMDSLKPIICPDCWNDGIE